jgi:hypothetical protein
MATGVSLLATLITLAFTVAVFVQWLQRRGPHRLVWTFALLCYGVATLVQFLAEAGGWTLVEFRLWYLAGGLLTAACLGQGTAMLLLAPRAWRVLLICLVVVTLWAVYRTFTVPLTLTVVLPAAGKVTPQATHLPADLRALAALLNIYGTLLLVGGAVWSALVYADRMLDKRRRAGHRLIATLLIAAGSLIVAGAGSLETFGNGEYLYAGEIIGITVIFIGFLRVRETLPVPMPLPRFRRRAPADQAVPETPPAGPTRSLRNMRERASTPRR